MVARPLVESVKEFLREKLPTIRNVLEVRIRHDTARLDILVIVNIKDLDLNFEIYEVLDEIHDFPGDDAVELYYRVLPKDQSLLDSGGYRTIWSKQEQEATAD